MFLKENSERKEKKIQTLACPNVSFRVFFVFFFNRKSIFECKQTFSENFFFHAKFNFLRITQPLRYAEKK